MITPNVRIIVGKQLPENGEEMDWGEEVEKEMPL